MKTYRLTRERLSKEGRSCYIKLLEDMRGWDDPSPSVCAHAELPASLLPLLIPKRDEEEPGS